MAGDIVRAQPDVIMSQGGLALNPLVRAGVKIPIVFTYSGDPVEAKIVASFNRPGGNMTGISYFTLEIVGKRLELLREILPGLKRVAFLANPQHPGEQKEFAAAQAAAAKLGLAVRYFPVTSEAELKAALTDIARGRDEAIVAFADAFTISFAEKIAAFSVQQGIPAVDGWAPFARRGNLLIYGPVLEDSYRRLAVYVDKILKGAKPGDLPVELPTKLELVINAKTARALGLTIPASVLLRADEVIQ
jgi:putative ABC transport system substrate-binding protein